MMKVFAPLMLPFLQLVTLGTLPMTALYALAGLLATPVIVPLLIFKNIASLLILSPVWLPALIITVPTGGMLAFVLLSLKVVKALWLVFTPLLWPFYYFCAWCGITSAITQVVVTDTIMPWIIPLRFTFLAAILPKLLKS